MESAFKKYTAKKIIKEIESNPDESRRNWMLWIFKSHGDRNPNNKYFQFWIQDNHPISLETNEMLNQRLNYLHDNPVRAEIVEEQEHYLYSSAVDYIDGKGLLVVDLIL